MSYSNCGSQRQAPARSGTSELKTTDNGTSSTPLLLRPAPLGSGAKSRCGCMAINILHKGSCGDNHRPGLNKEGTGGIRRLRQAGLRAQGRKLRLRLRLRLRLWLRLRPEAEAGAEAEAEAEAVAEEACG